MTTQRKVLLKGLIVVVMGAAAVATPKAASARPLDTITCANSCHGQDLASNCTCSAELCEGVDGNVYPYTIDCVD